jgi:hypothetical protein
MKTMTLSRWLGVAFVVFALPKLASLTIAVDNFERWGLGDPGRYAVGAVEVLLGIGMWVPRARVWATLALLCIMGGATVAHLVAREYVMLAAPLLFGGLLVRALHVEGNLRFDGGRVA